MEKIVRLFFFFSFSLSICAQQNLIPNPGFELNVSCPSASNGWPSCSSWDNVNLQTGSGLWGTPDYFHVCGTNNTAPPFTFSGNCSTKNGSAMMGIVLYNVPYANYREYISTSLTKNLSIGKLYAFSFWLNNGSAPISPWTIKNIGAHFSIGTLNQVGFGVINAIPQCEIVSNVACTEWTKYTFTIVATSAWNQVTIGSFRNDAANAPTQTFANQGGNPSAYANYFIDDVELIEVPETNDIKEMLLIYNLRVFPSPFQNVLVLQYDGLLQMLYEVRSLLGQKVFDGVTDRTIELNTRNLASGIYLVQVRVGDQTAQYKLVKP